MSPKNSWKMAFPLFSCQLLFQMSGSLDSWCRNIAYCTHAVQLLCKGVLACTASLPYLTRCASSVLITYARQLCETTEALSQHCSGPPVPSDSLQQDLLATLFLIEGKSRLDPVVPACLSIRFRDSCTRTSSFAVTAMLWCTAPRGVWAVSSWGRYWWYHTASGWLTQPCQRLPPCCKCGRSKQALLSSFP